MCFVKVEGLTPRSESAGGKIYSTCFGGASLSTIIPWQRERKPPALCRREAGGDGGALAESRTRGIRTVAERPDAARGRRVRGGLIYWCHVTRREKASS